MSFHFIRKIPSAEDIRQDLSLPQDLQNLKKQRDQNIKDVFLRKSDKFLLIIGPCSADNEDAVCEYVSRLGDVQKKVEDKIMIIPRIYTNKPRTTGRGYKGMAHQPVPTEAPNIVEGIKAIRRMHIRALRESGLTAADEMLYPGNYPYLEDLLSYVAIGARSVENQQHRLTVSGLDIPVGMKNPTSGDLGVMLNSIEAAQIGHDFIYNGCAVHTDGNALVHGILRGSINPYGRHIPNYHYEDLTRLVSMYEQRQLKNPTIFIDCNHSNSNKDYRQQARVAMEVIHCMRQSRSIKTYVRGLMIESYLEEGAQDVTGKVYGKSITDSCLGWGETEKLIFKLFDYI
jgi:3-deoxy-7-phosphoheptulonate synthase